MDKLYTHNLMKYIINNYSDMQVRFFKANIVEVNRQSDISITIGDITKQQLLQILILAGK